MKLTTTAGSMLLVAAIIMSCNQEAKQQYAESVTDMEKVQSEKLAQEPIPVPGTLEQQPTADSAPTPAKPTAITAPPVDWDRKIIKNASVKYEVKNFDQYNKELRERIRKFGGYVAQEENHQYDDRREIALTIKVPVEQFEPMMNELQGRDAKQVERTISTEDVTGQVIDTRSRLEAKKQMRLKYLEFLRQSKNMQEVLAVQNEINSIQEEIESASGRIQSLGKQAAFSTINLSFYEPVAGFATPEPSNPSFFSKTGEAFSRGAELVKGLLLVIVSIWPLVLGVLAGIFIWKKKRTPAPVTSK